MDLSDQLNNWAAYKEASRNEKLKPTLKTHNFSDDDRKEIMLLGDTHVGSRQFEEPLLKEHIEYSLDCKIPMILMGDMIEAATRDSVGSGVYEQNEMIDAQVQHFIHLFKKLKEEGLILGMHGGNHEARVYNKTGFDLGRSMARELGVTYFSWGQLHYIRVGGEGYTFYTTHGSSGARLPHTKIKGVLDLANLVDAEVYGMGHLHQLSHHIRNFYCPDLRNKTVKEKQKHFILTGSYLSHWGSYAHIKSMEPTRNGCAKVKLKGNEHSIRVSL